MPPDLVKIEVRARNPMTPNDVFTIIEDIHTYTYLNEVGFEERPLQKESHLEELMENLVETLTLKEKTCTKHQVEFCKTPYCYHCDRDGHSTQECWKKNRRQEKLKECYFCHKLGHEEREC